MTDYREDAYWSVYIHIIPKSMSGYEYDKYYVGITSRIPQKRWGSNGINYKRQKFYNAIKKYGWNNIEHEIIASNITKQEALDLESTLIELLHSKKEYGYNLTDGGDIIDNNVKIPLYQFDICGNYIRYCSNREDCTDDIIWEAVLGTSKAKHRYYDWIFAREEDVVIIKNKVMLKDYSSWDMLGYVFQFDRDNNYIKGYRSVLAASKATNVSPKTIFDMIYHNNRTTYGEYLFRCIEDIEIIDGKPYIKNYSNDNKIYKFDIYNRLICVYNTRKEVIEDNDNMNYHKLDNHLYHTDSSVPRPISPDGFIYALQKDVEIIDGNYHIKNFSLEKCHFIYCFDAKTLEFIDYYPNAHIAESYTQVPYYNIAYNARKKLTTAKKHNYVFRFVTDVKRLEDGSFILLDKEEKV